MLIVQDFHQRGVLITPRSPTGIRHASWKYGLVAAYVLVLISSRMMSKRTWRPSPAKFARRLAPTHMRCLQVA